MPAFSIKSNSPDRRVARIEIHRIEISAHSPRRAYDESELQRLADSIRQFGLLCPLLVRRKGAGFELIAGERRLRALRLLGYSHADAIITAAFDRDCALMGLIENLQREELHFLDTAEACKRILTEHGLTQEELAASLGKSPSALANLLRLLRLDKAVRSCIREYGLSERHARALLRLEDAHDQLNFAQRAYRERLSVRQLENLIAPQPVQKSNARNASGMIRDHRLVINALKDTVRQLKRIGVPASSRVETHADYYDIIVTIRTSQDPIAENK